MKIQTLNIFEKYRAYVEKETANQGLTIEEIETLIEYETFFLKWERRISYESNNYSHHRSNSATRYRVDRIERLKKEIEKAFGQLSRSMGILSYPSIAE